METEHYNSCHFCPGKKVAVNIALIADYIKDTFTGISS